MSTQNPHRCFDGACVLLVPGTTRGMGTNGGCRCMPLKTTPNERVKLRAGVRWLAEEVERLRGELDAFTTKGTALGDRLRGEGLSNCWTCKLLNGDSCEPADKADTPADKWVGTWLDYSDDSPDLMPPRDATGCPAWKPKTDQKGTQ